VRKTNNKTIILGTILVLVLFFISACQGTVGAPTKGGRDLTVRNLYSQQATVSGETNTNKLSAFSIDVINPNKVGGRMSIQDNTMVFGMQGAEGSFSFDGALTSTGNLIVVGSATFENKQIELNEGTLQLHQLSGQGNAYACLNANGVLFRSNTRCTTTQQ